MVRLPKRPREHVLEEESEQFARRVLPSEWIVERKEHDYGVDLQVEIVRNESVTGARFSIQLKSTDNLKVRKKSYIAHPCSTSALFYYLQLPEPVVYLIYDAKGDQGYWVWIQEFTRQLDSKWKSKDKIDVRLPKENVFDGWAVKQIAAKVLDWHEEARWRQAIKTANNPYYHYTFTATEQEFNIGMYPRYPDAERDSPLTFKGTFKFDESEDGRRALEELEKSIKTGSYVQVDSRFFEGFDLPSAHPELFAHVEDFHLDTIELHPIVSEHRVPVRVLALDSEKNVLGELPYIEFRRVQSGTEETTFTNELQNISTVMRHVINYASRKMSFATQIRLLNQNAVEIRDALCMHQALRRAKYLKVEGLAVRQSFELDISDSNVPEIPDSVIELVEDLALIQEHTRFPLIWPGKITPEEVVVIKQAASAIRSGTYIESTSSVTVVVEKSTARNMITMNEASEAQLGLDFENVEMTILGKEMSLGPGRIIFPKVEFKSATKKLLKRLDTLPDDTPVKLQFDALEAGTVQLRQSLACAR